MHPYVPRAPSTIAKTWKQVKCPSTDKWIEKIWCVCVCVYIHKMKYYSAIKKNEMMPFATTWMNLEIVILSKVRKRKTNTR